MSKTIRICGVQIPNKPIIYALCSIHGIGRTTASNIVGEAAILPARRAHDLTEDEVRTLQSIINTHHIVEGAKRRETDDHIRHRAQIKAQARAKR